MLGHASEREGGRDGLHVGKEGLFVESLVLCRRRRQQQRQGVETVSDPLYHTISLSNTPVAMFTFVLILEWEDRRRPCSVSHSVPSLSIRTREGIVPLPRLRGGGTRSRPAGRVDRVVVAAVVVACQLGGVVCACFTQWE